MRPQKIDNDLNDFAKKFAKELFGDRRSNFDKPLDNLNELLVLYKSKGTDFAVHVRIIKLIIYFHNRTLLSIKPDIHQKLVDYTDNNLRNIFYRKNKATTFSKEIVKALRYDALQKYYAYKIADQIGLKACPYCNAMLAITMDVGGEKKARFQLDHFFPKSKYPFLSTSYFNLIPCCGNCNQGKSNSRVSLGTDFHLYSNKTPYNAFKFKLDNIDVIKRTIGVRKEMIKIKFTHNNARDEEFVKKHNEDYAIQSIYETQKDIVEELVWKKQLYNNYNIKELSDILKISAIDVKRMLVGNYIEFENIHKRPLAKFMQDIAIDLDFF